MVKTSKENKVQYVTPKVKAFEVRTENALLQASQDGWSDPGDAGYGELEED